MRECPPPPPPPQVLLEGDYLFHAYDTGDAMFFLKRGSVEILREGRQRELDLVLNVRAEIPTQMDHTRH